MPHFVFEYFGNILFKFAVASFWCPSHQQSNLVIHSHEFELLWQQQTVNGLAIVNPSFVMLRQKAFRQLNGDRNIKKFINATAIHHDLGRFWDVFNIDWWKFAQLFCVAQASILYGVSEEDVVKMESVAKGMPCVPKNKMKFPTRVSVVERDIASHLRIQLPSRKICFSCPAFEMWQNGFHTKTIFISFVCYWDAYESPSKINNQENLL